MDEFLSSNIPDAPTPLNSAGNPSQPNSNAAGNFDLRRRLIRKIKDRSDAGKMQYGENEDDDATSRYFGSFSIESKRNVWDLLEKHPKFRLGRIENNTREVLKNDPTVTQENGGYRITQQQPQASQPRYQ